MIKMVHAEGRNCPKLFCDFCDEEMVGHSGNVVWQEKDDKPSTVLFCHKTCDPKYSDDDVFYLWQELDAFFIYLLNNMKINFEKVRDRARMFGSL